MQQNYIKDNSKSKKVQEDDDFIYNQETCIVRNSKNWQHINLDVDSS
jgi:hypothetical protein